MSIIERTEVTLELSCDFCPPNRYGPNRLVFVAQKAELCYRAARKQRWKIYPSQLKAKCPHCGKKRGSEQ